VYRADALTGAEWSLIANDQVVLDASTGMASVTARAGGVYVVRNSLYAGAVAGIVIAVVVFVAVVTGVYIVRRRNAPSAAAYDEAKERIVDGGDRKPATELANRS
jgi:hypothetical protein